ncbi:hypothetical protein [Kribbella endophytica]
MTDHRPEERTPDLTDADFSNRPTDADADADAGVRDNDLRAGDLHDGDADDGGVRDGGVRDGGVRDGGVREGGVREGDAPDGDLRDDRLARAAGGDSLGGDRTDLADDRVAPADEAAHDVQAGEAPGTSDEATTRNEQSSAPTSTEGPLVAEDAAVDFRSRWEVIQQGFVDDPRQAVSEADKLVDDLLKRLSATFDDQHQELERQWSDGEPSTEDLRGALQKYRAFFQRLLAL